MSTGVIALDLGGTKLAAGVIGARGRVLYRKTILLQGRTGDRVGDLACEALRQCLQFARRHKLALQGVGVSVPGISSPAGRVWAPNIPGWKQYPLGARLRAVARPHNLPVEIDSDRACYILGEAWLGAAKGCRNAIFFSVGTGVAAGLLTDGRVLRGAHGTAGSIGWMALNRPFRPEYKYCGCFEFHASGEGLARHGRSLAANVSTAADLFAACKRGDPAATNIIQEAVIFWGMGIANLVSAFDPEIVVFGGGVFGPARSLLKAIRSEAMRWAQPVAMRKVKFRASALASDAGLLGAAYLGLHATPNPIASSPRV